MSGDQPKFELSVPQIAGGALAAVTAAVAASFLGVAGTVIGAAVASIATTIGGAVYTHYLKRTSETVVAWRDHKTDESSESGESTPVKERRRPLPWLKLGAAAAAVFAITMAAIFVYQGISGSRLDEQTRGVKDVTPVEQQKAPQKGDQPTDQPSSAPSTKAPTPTPTPSKTPTSKPTPTPTPTPSETTSVDPSDAPTTTPPDPAEETAVEEPPPTDQADQGVSPGPSPGTG